MAEIRVNDIGTRIVATMKEDCEAVDVSTFSAITFIFKKPSGSIIERSGTFYSDGTDGKVQYITVSGDIDEVGIYKVQAQLEISSYVYTSSTNSIKVLPNLS